jgi:TPR repeat protein
MALIYREGLGVSKDPVETAKWLNRAAEMGHVRAMLDLSKVYSLGDGVPRDPSTAYMWVWIAFNSKLPGAEQQELTLHNQMSAKDIERAKKKAAEWSKKHTVPGLRLRREAAAPQPK